MRLILFAWLLVAPIAAAETITFETRDGTTVYAERYASNRNHEAPLILLFHQGGGDGRGEYGDIAGRLNAAGFHAIAVDQRRGGDVFGGINRTVQNLPAGAEYGYCEAYPDLEAALDYALELGHTGTIVAWGSSYSAALVFQLAARRSEDIDAVLAFSPASGGPLADCRPDLFMDEIDVPVLVLRPASEFGIESVQSQMKAFEAQGFTTHVAEPGAHGSSMLVAERVAGDTEGTWDVVYRFLDTVR